jgi:hypothetical protein
MEPVLPDAPVEESEFDLDVRLTAVARHISDDRAQAQTNGGTCPQPSQCIGCPSNSYCC